MATAAAKPRAAADYREVRRLTLTLALAASLALPPTALAADEIIVKRVPGLDRAERLAVRQDADVTLVER